MEKNDDEQDVNVDELKQELDSAKKDKKSLEGKVDSLEAENKKLKEILAAEEPDVEKLQSENAALKKTLKEAASTLEVFVDNQKTELIEEITEHTEMKADELKEMDLDDLRLIKKTVDSFKGIKKGVKAAGGSGIPSSGEDTVGDLYGQPQTRKPSVNKGGD